MRLLFVHQNFPGQYRHIAGHYAAQGHEVVAIGEKKNLAHTFRVPGVRRCAYEVPELKAAGTDANLARAIHRGRCVAAAATGLKREGLVPDVIFTHIGWGEALFLKDIFPQARVLLYCEFFYRARGGDLGFDPEFPVTPEKILRVRTMNAPLLMALDACDLGLAPTRWQHHQFPSVYKPRIAVIHDGIDTDVASPGAPNGEELITYVARNLEPYRGFHVFMRAIPEIQRRRPKARIVIVGGDEVSYSPRLPPGQTYCAARRCTCTSLTRSCSPGHCSSRCRPAASSSARARRRSRRRSATATTGCWSISFRRRRSPKKSITRSATRRSCGPCASARATR